MRLSVKREIVRRFKAGQLSIADNLEEQSVVRDFLNGSFSVPTNNKSWFKPQPIELRFRKYAEIKPGDACWNWRGYVSSTTGYGMLGVHMERERFGCQNIAAHRLSWFLFRGPLTPDQHVDHLCRNRTCVNPAHLEPVSCRENILRGIGPSAENATKTHCINGHEFTEANTYVRPKTKQHRSCRQCIRERAATKRAMLSKFSLTPKPRKPKAKEWDRPQRRRRP